jgi:CRP/FNR family transcriptional regulator, anaerobic regulatory protein
MADLTIRQIVYYSVKKYSMNNFIEFLHYVSELSDETKRDLEHCIKTFEFPKNHILLKQGQVCNYLYFVDKGLLRLFYYQDGKDISDYFAVENNLIGGIDSFFSRKPSDKIIETLEQSNLSAISFDDIEKLFAKYHDFERVGRLLSIDAFLSMQERLFAIQFHTAKQRYDNLFKSSPDILQRVPLGHVASFLGITQVTLSRIRGQK